MVFFFNFPYHFSKNQDVQIKSKDRQNLEDGRSFVFSYFPQDSWISMSLGSIQILSKKTKIIKIDKYSSRSFDLPKKMASSIDEFSTQFVKKLGNCVTRSSTGVTTAGSFFPQLKRSPPKEMLTENKCAKGQTSSSHTSPADEKEMKNTMRCWGITLSAISYQTWLTTFQQPSSSPEAPGSPSLRLRCS